MEAPSRNLPCLAEFSIQHLLEQQYVDKWVVDQYLPDIPTNCDRSFFWSVWLRCQPAAAEDYIHRVLSQHQEEKLKPPPKKDYTDIKDDFLDKLLEYHVKQRRSAAQPYHLPYFTFRKKREAHLHHRGQKKEGR